MSINFILSKCFFRLLGAVRIASGFYASKRRRWPFYVSIKCCELTEFCLLISKNQEKSLLVWPRDRRVETNVFSFNLRHCTVSLSLSLSPTFVIVTIVFKLCLVCSGFLLWLSLLLRKSKHLLLKALFYQCEKLSFPPVPRKEKETCLSGQKISFALFVLI